MRGRTQFMAVRIWRPAGPSSPASTTRDGRRISPGEEPGDQCVALNLFAYTRDPSAPFAT